MCSPVILVLYKGSQSAKLKVLYVKLPGATLRDENQLPYSNKGLNKFLESYDWKRCPILGACNRPFARKDWNVNWFRDVTSGCQDAGEDCIGVYLEMTIWMFKTPASCTDLMLFYLNEYHMKI